MDCFTFNGRRAALRIWTRTPCLLILAALSSCARAGSEGAAVGNFRCRCGTLTDTDLAGTKDVNVCTSSMDRATKQAPGCAKARTQLTVQSCTCKAVSEPCPSDACTGK